MKLSDQHYRLDPSTEAVHSDQHVLNQWERKQITSRQAMRMIAYDNGWDQDEGFASVEAFEKFANSLGYWRDKYAMLKMLEELDRSW